MTVAELIKKLAQYDFDARVFLVNMSDDTGESDVALKEADIDEDHGHILISHTPMPDDEHLDMDKEYERDIDMER